MIASVFRASKFAANTLDAKLDDIFETCNPDDVDWQSEDTMSTTASMGMISDKSMTMNGGDFDAKGAARESMALTDFGSSFHSSVQSSFQSSFGMSFNLFSNDMVMQDTSAPKEHNRFSPPPGLAPPPAIRSPPPPVTYATQASAFLPPPGLLRHQTIPTPGETLVHQVQATTECGCPSFGSICHHIGDCTPCKFFRGRRGCKEGPNCNLCHYPHEELTYSGIRKAMRNRGLQKRQVVSSPLPPGVPGYGGFMG